MSSPATLSTSFAPFQSFLQTAKKIISENLHSFGKKIISIKDTTAKTLKNIAKKIKDFVKDNYKYVFFTLLSIYAFQFSPTRFLLGALASLIIQKVDYSPKEKILSAYSFAQNILGVLGIILEQNICPICDPKYYFAPCLSGIATAKVGYNLFQYYFNKIHNEN